MKIVEEIVKEEIDIHVKLIVGFIDKINKFFSIYTYF